MHRPADRPDRAFYCPADDTIYLAEPFAAAVRDGRLSRWPSGDTVDGALGDMAVAYVIAHEEAHNIQAELGLFDGSISIQAIELHADCLAGHGRPMPPSATSSTTTTSTTPR